jgi:hypothetical protein
MSRICLLLMTLLCVPLVALAEEATSKPSTQPSGEVIDVKDFANLKEMIGTTVTVRGKVREVFVPQSGSVSIFNFEGIDRRAFNVVIPKANLEAVNAGFDGDVAKAVKDQTITITGAIADYRGNPQIQLTKTEQLKIEKKD